MEDNFIELKNNRADDFLKFAEEENSGITFERMRLPVQPAGIDLEKGTMWEPEFLFISHSKYFKDTDKLFKNILDFFVANGNDVFGVYQIIPDKSQEDYVVLKWSPLFPYKNLEKLKEIVDNEVY